MRRGLIRPGPCVVISQARRRPELSRNADGPPRKAAPYGGEGTSLLKPRVKEAPTDAQPVTGFLDDVLGPLLRSDAAGGSAVATPGRRDGRGRGARKGAQHAAFAAHASRLRELITAEFDCELEATESRLLTWTPTRLAQEGLALFGLVCALLATSPSPT